MKPLRRTYTQLKLQKINRKTDHHPHFRHRYGYCWLVTSNEHAKGFRTDNGLKLWLMERDLLLTKPLDSAWQFIMGEYTDVVHQSLESFAAVPDDRRTVALDNYQYTAAKAVHTLFGGVEIHFVHHSLPRSVGAYSKWVEITDGRLTRDVPELVDV